MKKCLEIFFVYFVLLFVGSSFAHAVPEIIAVPHDPAAIEIRLKTVLLANTEWTVESIQAELVKTNAIFAQCGVQISEMSLLKDRASGLISTDDQTDRLGQKLVKMGYRSDAELTVIFAGKFGGEMLRGAGGQTGGFSYIHSLVSGAGNTGWYFENLSFIMDTSQTPDYQRIRHPGYSPLAHEMGHVLLDTGHVRERNLMADAAELVEPTLTKQQCAVLVKSPLLKK